MRGVLIPQKIANDILSREANYQDPESGERFYKYNTSFQEHIINSTSFIGWIFFVVFAGVGFTAMPWDLILDYYYRPKPIDEGNFNERTKLLL
jgi:LMBR1 domain-containing protein 1